MKFKLFLQKKFNKELCCNGSIIFEINKTLLTSYGHVMIEIVFDLAFRNIIMASVSKRDT